MLSCTQTPSQPTTVINKATRQMIDACGSHVCSSAAETTSCQDDEVSDTAVRGRHWQRRRCPTLCQLRSGSQPIQSPDFKTQKHMFLFVKIHMHVKMVTFYTMHSTS